QSIAAGERILRGLGAEQADTAGAMRMRVFQRGLAEQRLGDRRRKLLGERGQLIACAQGAAAGEDAYLLALVEDGGGAIEHVAGRHRRAAGARSGDVMRDVAL